VSDEPAPGLPFSLTTRSPKNGQDALLEGWSSFTDTWRLVDIVVALLLALALGALIAFHPAARRRSSNLEQLEQPKTLLMYAVVAAVVAQIVQVQPAMAFVIFGIGGLVRFRTDVKDTGRVILVTVLGLCCGLKIYVVALPAAVIGWLLILFLEQRVSGVIRISGVPETALHESAKAHRALIAAAGCKIVGEQTKFLKREFSFVVTAPASLDRTKLESSFESLRQEVRGVVDWERI
jgi:hypothetical protein